MLATYTHISDTREQKGSDFPFVDIYKDGKQYITLGTEVFTPIIRLSIMYLVLLIM